MIERCTIFASVASFAKSGSTRDSDSRTSPIGRVSAEPRSRQRSEGWSSASPSPRSVGSVSVLGIRVSLDGWWTEGRADQLLDQAHAALVEHTLQSMGGAGWETRVEYTFNEYGERGSVDILGWRAVDRTLAIAEIKSRIDDVQDTNATFSRKCRLLPLIPPVDWGEIAFISPIIAAAGVGLAGTAAYVTLRLYVRL